MKKPKQITIQLESKGGKAFEEAWGIEPLAEIVEKAVCVLNPNGHRSSEASWLAKMALRAVAEGVVRDGCLPMPLRVDLGFARAEDGYTHEPSNYSAKPDAPIPLPSIKQTNAKVEMRPLEIEVPEIFFRLAKFYGLEPVRLAAALVWEFCCDPPHDLILVQRKQSSDDPDDEERDEEPPPELNRLDR